LSLHYKEFKNYSTEKRTYFFFYLGHPVVLHYLKNSLFKSLTQLIVLNYINNCFDQLCGHPQATQTRKIRITIGCFIFGQNEISVLLL